MPGSVLLVESTFFIRLLVRKNLERIGGLTVTDVFDADEALKELREKDHGLIILDLGLYGGDGLGFLSEIRTEFPSIPVVVLSSDSRKLKEAEGLKIAAGLSVPVDMELLKEKVRELIEA